MAWDDMPTDDKYITFKSGDFYAFLDRDGIGDEVFYEKLKALSLKDAVVIRRQDKFASPCLATYAAMIALVASEHQDPKTKTQLLQISDYFEDQAKLAAEEGFKLPDL